MMTQTVDSIGQLDFFSVEYAPDLQANVIFSESSSQVFREDEDISKLSVSDDIAVMPWGADNQMPYDIMKLVDGDETVSRCMNFNSEVAFASGLRYGIRKKDAAGNIRPVPVRIIDEVDDFCRCNNLYSIFFGQCADMKYFDFCVSLIFLDKDNRKVTRIVRKHAAYCRFAVADELGRIPYIVYGQWRNHVNKDNCEVIPMLDPDDLLCDLRRKAKERPDQKIYAVVSKVPKVSSTYYPIPSYASLFRSDWYDIKKLIGKAKKAKLKNSAPIKYHIEVAKGYWDRAIDAEGITDPAEAKLFVGRLKKQMIDFLSGADNAGKVLFSTTFMTPDGKELPEVKVNKISSDEKEGGDYTTDIQEAVNMICFSMGVHSNLVGSVPGKSQSNNSGSDKRELYTIAQTLQKPYHAFMLEVHDLVCRFNGWSDYVAPEVDIIQLTTLDQHTDARKV